MLGMGDNGDEWEFERIGTEREKMQVEKEVQELRERLAEVDELKKRRDEIELELASVWTDKGDSLAAPEYTQKGEEAEPRKIQLEQEQETATEDGEDEEFEETEERLDAVAT